MQNAMIGSQPCEWAYDFKSSFEQYEPSTYKSGCGKKNRRNFSKKWKACPYCGKPVIFKEE